MSTRKDIELVAKSLMGLPYFWGGNTPSDAGLDCSGFVCWVWHCCGLLPDFPAVDRTAERLFGELPVISTPEAGDAAFYSSTENGRISHVVLVLNDGKIIGANGGDRPLAAELDANGLPNAAYRQRMKQKDARVKLAQNVSFRRYFRGVRRAPGI